MRKVLIVMANDGLVVRNGLYDNDVLTVLYDLLFKQLSLSILLLILSILVLIQSVSLYRSLLGSLSILVLIG